MHWIGQKFVWATFLARIARWFIFNPKIQIWVNFGGPWNGKYWYTYVMTIWYQYWYIIWPFGNLVVFPTFWYIVSRKNWQLCFGRWFFEAIGRFFSQKHLVTLSMSFTLRPRGSRFYESGLNLKSAKMHNTNFKWFRSCWHFMYLARFRGYSFQN
jgi:hypothetical protein